MAYYLGRVIELQITSKTVGRYQTAPLCIDDTGRVVPHEETGLPITIIK